MEKKRGRALRPDVRCRGKAKIRARPEGTRKRRTRNMEKKRGRALCPDVRCRGKAVMRWMLKCAATMEAAEVGRGGPALPPRRQLSARL